MLVVSGEPADRSIEAVDEFLADLPNGLNTKRHEENVE